MSAQAGLIGTQLSLRTLAQATSTSTPVVTSFERTVIVSDSLVEYPDVSSLFNPGSVVPPGFASSLVDVGAKIDSSLTTLGLVPSDISFIGNELFINVESLSFNPTTFARINLVVQGGPATVPVPTAVWLFGSGLIGLIGLKRKPSKVSTLPA